MYPENQYPFVKPESNARKFWRVVFGTMVGFLFISILFFLLSVFLTIGMIAAFTPSAPAVKNNSILKITLPNQIVERSVSTPFDDMDFPLLYGNATSGLDDILACIDNAATDNKIRGIYLNLSSVNASPATIQEIRGALEKFRDSGKFIYAYSDYLSQGGYYLVSVADKIILNPMGSLDFRGVAFQTLFFKGLIDKLNLDIQVIRHGEFKSAVEPYTLDKMSEANRAQLTLLSNTIWNTMLGHIEKSRRISRDSLDLIATNLLCENAESARYLKLVDELNYAPQVESQLKQLVGVQEDNDLDLISLSEYRKTVKNPSRASADKIALVYAVGDIVDGKGTNSQIGSESLTKTLRKAYQDDKVKAIVLRINSPGGSALASEVIWSEIEAAKKAGKIVIASMGDYAASGGYYIACNADMIIAQPNTLTGSIGVFGIIPSLQNFLKNKLGVTVDVVKTNPHADYATGFRKLDEVELKKMQVSVEDIYATFTQRVATGRNMTVEKVDEIGQGRVWAGADAINIGLVDQLGSIEDAVAAAARMAKLSDYSLEYYPKQQDWFSILLGRDKDEAVDASVKAQLGDLYFTYAAYKQVMNASGIQARLPMEIVFE